MDVHRLDLKGLAGALAGNDLAWVSLLQERLTRASRMVGNASDGGVQSELLLLLISALHIVDAQEKKLHDTVAGVAEDSERAERAQRDLKAQAQAREQDLRLAREHSVQQHRDAMRAAEQTRRDEQAAAERKLRSEQKAKATAEKKKAVAEKEKAATEKKLKAEKAAAAKARKRLAPPDYWRNSSGSSKPERFPTSHVKRELQQLMRASSAPGHNGRPGMGMSGCRNDPSLPHPGTVIVKHVERIENYDLWLNYQRRKESMKHARAPDQLAKLRNVGRLVKGKRIIDQTLNEFWLWVCAPLCLADLSRRLCLTPRRRCSTGPIMTPRTFWPSRASTTVSRS